MYVCTHNFDPFVVSFLTMLGKSLCLYLSYICIYDGHIKFVFIHAPITHPPSHAPHYKLQPPHPFQAFVCTYIHLHIKFIFMHAPPTPGVNATMAMTPACAFDPLLSPQCAQNLVGKDYFENMYQASKILC